MDLVQRWQRVYCSYRIAQECIQQLQHSTKFTNTDVIGPRCSFDQHIQLEETIIMSISIGRAYRSIYFQCYETSQSQVQGRTYFMQAVNRVGIVHEPHINVQMIHIRVHLLKLESISMDAKLLNGRPISYEQIVKLWCLTSDILTFFTPYSDPKSTDGASESCHHIISLRIVLLWFL